MHRSQRVRVPVAKPRVRRCGFTLVELLVVIGIIALVIAILFPTLSRARETARTVACASNIRQIGVANFAYANANGGHLPVPILGVNLHFGIPQSAIWATDQYGILDYTQGTLIPYLGGPALAERIFLCPGDDDPTTYEVGVTLKGDTEHGWDVVARDVIRNPRNFSYVWNGKIVTYNPKHGGIWGSVRLTQIRCPARKVLLFENREGVGLAPVPVTYDPMTYVEPAHLLIGLRHNNRSNVFYADGHVELFDSRVLQDETVHSLYDNRAWITYFDLDSD